MANLNIPNTITADSFIVATEHVENYGAIQTWLNNRNAGTDTWANMKVSAAVSNPVVISSSASLTEVSINNTATDGDSVLSFELSGVAKFTLGVDDGAGDVFKGGTTAIGTSTWIQVDSTGAVLKPLQPSFLALAITTDITLNSTGDGTVYTCEYGTEIYDQNSDYNDATYTFTAPITGRYQLNARIDCVGLTTSHTQVVVEIVTSNRAYAWNDTLAIAGDRNFMASALADMDASDTATVTLTALNDTKVVELRGSGTGKYNSFSGSLIN